MRARGRSGPGGAGGHVVARRLRVAWVILLTVAAAPAGAEVSRVEIATRHAVLGGRAFGSAGPYERLVGRLYFTIDPANPRNRVIVDLDRAPKNARGGVELSADLTILRPRDQARGNGVALLDIANRGRKMALSAFNRAAGTGDLSTDAEVGDGFLFTQGFTVVWVGWEFDVSGRDGAMSIDLPVAAGTAGIVRAVVVPGARGTQLTFGDLAAYRPVNPEAADATLTVRDSRDAAPAPIPRERWRLAGNVVSFDDGFEAGRLYELAYSAADAPIGGLGLAAVRDAASWLKYAADSAAPVRHALAFGVSQSGRFLRDFLYQGFNADERNRLVFDGVIPHIAGASRMDLNRRWATPVSQGQYTETSFPFADAALRDPVTGIEEGTIENARARAHQPKVFYTNTAVEYWGGARSAALLHTTPDGARDVTPPAGVRIYFLTGTQHVPSGFPPAETTGQQVNNPNDYWWAMRALVVAMRRWVVEGVEPPPSRYPRLADGTLVRVGAVAFPDLPSVSSPRAVQAGRRVANPFVARDGAPGTPLPLLVPQVDTDGNERAGIRLPEVAVPLATYTGWNFRHPRVGAPADLFPLLGSYVPFARGRAEREGAGDPRASIEERYATRADYLARVRDAASALSTGGYLLAEDIPYLVGHAGDHWDWLAQRAGAGSSARGGR